MAALQNVIDIVLQRLPVTHAYELSLPKLLEVLERLAFDSLKKKHTKNKKIFKNTFITYLRPFSVENDFNGEILWFAKNVFTDSSEL